MPTEVEKVSHTPGPWLVSKLDGRTIHHPAGFWSPADDANFSGASDVPKYEGVATAMCRDPEVTKANARLIAAAPDLLNALKEIVAVENTMDGADYEDVYVRCVEIARAAIAKAERGAK